MKLSIYNCEFITGVKKLIVLLLKFIMKKYELTDINYMGSFFSEENKISNSF